MIMSGDKFESKYTPTSQNGKGDTYRPVDWNKYGENYDNIFRKNKKKDKKKTKK